MSFIATFPTGCAPTMGTPQNPGWDHCTTGCQGCTTCKPDPNKDCGQMMIGAGLNCAPPGCVGECCLPSSPGPRPGLGPGPKSGQSTKITPAEYAVIGVGGIAIIGLIIYLVMRR